MSETYSQRGVSASKSEVHAAIKGLDKGLFPKAFCKILPDIGGGNPEYVNIMHADTAGTKTSLAYLYWRETGDVSVWKGIAQDAIVMNLDDMACVGCTGGILLSSTIGRNKNLIPGEVIRTLIEGTTEFIRQLAEYGIDIHQAGGETADVGDIVRTIDVGYTTFARMKKEDVVVNDIQAGNVIIGLASFGKSTYEEHYNSGIGSNGLTNARHDMLAKVYANRYPEAYDPHIPEELVFSGPYQLTDQPEALPLSVGKMLLSPTRTYLPFLQQAFLHHKKAIRGVIHCTGGGQTKCLKFVEGIHIIKDQLFEVPPIFSLIQQAAGTDWKEMYQVFNMGHRLEIYTDESTASQLLALADSFEIEAKIIGRCEEAKTNSLSLISPKGNFTYLEN